MPMMPRHTLVLEKLWFTEICFTSKRKDDVRTLVQASIFGTWKKKIFIPVSEEEGGKRKSRRFYEGTYVTISRVFIIFSIYFFKFI